MQQHQPHHIPAPNHHDGHDHTLHRQPGRPHYFYEVIPFMAEITVPELKSPPDWALSELTKQKTTDTLQRRQKLQLRQQQEQLEQEIKDEEKLENISVCRNGGLANQVLSHAVRLSLFFQSSDANNKKKNKEGLTTSKLKKHLPEFYYYEDGERSVWWDNVLDTSGTSRLFGLVSPTTKKAAAAAAAPPPPKHNDNNNVVFCPEDYWIDDGLGAHINKNQTIDSIHVKTVLQEMLSPSAVVKKVVDERLVRMGFLKDHHFNKGVCLHHPAGGDNWRRFCQKYSALHDNCLEWDQQPLETLLHHRLGNSTLLNGKTAAPARMIYFIGDHGPPDGLLNNPYGYKVLDPKLEHPQHYLKLLQRLNIPIDAKMNQESVADIYHRYKDIFELIDFFACLRMKAFVGNSVSTYSALQLTLREGHGSWYNSGVVPMSPGLPGLFPIPMVYTYTERSHSAGKILLQISIKSARDKLGPERSIHILYNGQKDTEFLDWLREQRVVIHAHEPAWSETIEKIRRAGSSKTSHLYAHRGNYLGTWQRIDVPDFIEAEYVLYLDADTIVADQFWLSDFDPYFNVTNRINNETTVALAFCQESEDIKQASNAGVTLMNVPYLRRTRAAFQRFIEEAADNPKKKKFSMPSDQGAYHDFYHPQLMDIKFNVKPYYANWTSYEKKIIHFHGPKPHELMKHLVGKQIKRLMKNLAQRGQTDSICEAMWFFSKVLEKDDQLRGLYCSANFNYDKIMLATCESFLQHFSTLKSHHGCDNVAAMVLKIKKEEMSYRKNRPDVPNRELGDNRRVPRYPLGGLDTGRFDREQRTSPESEIFHIVCCFLFYTIVFLYLIKKGKVLIKYCRCMKIKTAPTITATKPHTT